MNRVNVRSGFLVFKMMKSSRYVLCMGAAKIDR